MIAFAWIFVLAAATRVELVDEVYEIPPAEWRYVELNLRQKPASVSAQFEVQSSQEVRLALMTRDDLERLRNDLPHGVMAVTSPAKSGSLRYRVRRPGDYVLVVDNRVGGAHAASVHLRIALDFGKRAEPEVTQITPQRRLAVIVASFLFFFGVVMYSAKRFFRAIAERGQGSPHQ